MEEMPQPNSRNRFMAVQLFKSVMIETPLSHIETRYGSIAIASGIEEMPLVNSRHQAVAV